MLLAAKQRWGARIFTPAEDTASKPKRKEKQSKAPTAERQPESNNTTEKQES
jgi:hypothetical protein